MGLGCPKMERVSPMLAIYHSFKFVEPRLLNALEPPPLLILEIIVEVKSSKDNRSFHWRPEPGNPHIPKQVVFRLSPRPNWTTHPFEHQFGCIVQPYSS